MEVFETLILIFCYLFSFGVIGVLFFVCWKSIPLLYRQLKAHVKIMEKKAEKIEQDEADETITII